MTPQSMPSPVSESQPTAQTMNQQMTPHEQAWHGKGGSDQRFREKRPQETGCNTRDKEKGGVQWPPRLLQPVQDQQRRRGDIVAEGRQREQQQEEGSQRH